MPFHYVVDEQKHPITYNQELASQLKDVGWRSRFESGYCTQTNFLTVVLDPLETTLGILLPPAERGFGSVLTTDSGKTFREKDPHNGSRYVELKEEGAILRHKSDGKQVEVNFVYEKSKSPKSEKKRKLYKRRTPVENGHKGLPEQWDRPNPLSPSHRTFWF